jgi:hypothetical protein
MKKYLFAALFGATSAAQADVPFATDIDRPFHEYTWLTAHNAFATTLVPNQTLPIGRQLQLGVRGLMLDLHESAGRVRLCHGACIGTEPTLADTLNDEILPYVHSHVHAVVTLHLEDHVSRDALADELSRAPEAMALSFNPDHWETDTWPTVRQMAEAGQKLVIFTQQYRNAGQLDTSAGQATLLFDQDYTTENYWSMGPLATHDRTCRSRWDNLPLTLPGVSGRYAWPRLFVMNHFHDTPYGPHAWHDNRYDELRTRIDDHCLPAAGRKPNYIAVDFVEAGQAGSVIAALNLGTIEFFDREDGQGERLCAIHAGARRTVDLNEDELDRCPPHRVRSAVVRDVPAGTRVTLAERGKNASPAITIEVRHDLRGERALIARFDQSQIDDHVTAVTVDGGPKGGVTHATFEPPAR